MTALLAVDDLVVRYPLPRRHLFAARRTVTAVDSVGFQLHHGEILGLVGESGSGKSTTARAIVGLLPIAVGRIRLDGTVIDPRDRHGRRALYRRVQMIFQDPYASLDPRLTAGAIIAEPLRNFDLVGDRRAARRRAEELLVAVGLEAAHADRYPHEFSGGQRQRIGIARALAVDPDLLICDEPVSALDVSVQAQIINLLADLRRERALAILFIAHDLAVVRHLCDRVQVMQQGRIVETGDSTSLFENPQHPSTRGLLAAVLEPDPLRARQQLARLALAADAAQSAASE